MSDQQHEQRDGSRFHATTPTVRWQQAGAFLALLSVVTGAFGAHALSETLSKEAMRWWQTGHEYHVFGSFSLLFATNLLGRNGRWRTVILSLFTAGRAEKIQVNISNIAMYAITDPEVRTKYLEATTGIKVPEKKLILG